MRSACTNVALRAVWNERGHLVSVWNCDCYCDWVWDLGSAVVAVDVALTLVGCTINRRCKLLARFQLTVVCALRLDNGSGSAASTPNLHANPLSVVVVTVACKSHGICSWLGSCCIFYVRLPPDVVLVYSFGHDTQPSRQQPATFSIWPLFSFSPFRLTCDSLF